MAKKNIETLVQLIESFGPNRLQENKYKKLAKEAGDKIRKILEEDEEARQFLSTGITNDNIIVGYTTSTSEGMDEEKALEYMRKHKAFAPCIKTKEYIDESVLAGMIYNGDLSKKLILGLNQFKKSTTTYKLTVKEVK